MRDRYSVSGLAGHHPPTGQLLVSPRSNATGSKTTTSRHTACAAMRAAGTTDLGPILHPLSFLGVAVVVADGSLANFKLYLDAEGRFVAMGMPAS